MACDRSLIKFRGLAIPDVLLMQPRVFSDERGFFYESFHHEQFEQAVGRSVKFVQENHSFSRAGVLRGLHFQVPPRGQGKLIRVTRGEIFDVAVDLRAGSPTFGEWVGEILSGDNRCQLWIPEGFAHGFYVMSDFADVHYKCTAFYAPESESGIRWDSPELSIRWPIVSDSRLCISDRDACWSPFLDAL